MSSKFQPDLNLDTFISGTDDNQSRKEKIKERLIKFLNMRCSEQPSFHFPGDNNELSLAQRLYYILASKIADYLIGTFLNNDKKGNTDVNSSDWKWNERDIKIDEYALDEARKAYLTHYFYNRYGAKFFLRKINDRDLDRHEREIRAKKNETSNFLKGIVDRLVPMTGIGFSGENVKKYDVMQNPDISSVLRKNIIDGVASLIQQLSQGISYKVGDDEYGVFNPSNNQYKQNIESTDADFSAETYLSFVSKVDEIIKNAEEMKKTIVADIENIKSNAAINFDVDDVHGVADKMRNQKLISAESQIEDMILSLNTIKRILTQRSSVDRAKGEITSDAPAPKWEAKVTIPNIIMKAIYEQLPDFPVPVLGIVNALRPEEEGEEEGEANGKEKILAPPHYIKVNNKTINLDNFYNHGFLKVEIASSGGIMLDGVIPWLKNWYNKTTEKIEKKVKGDIYAATVPVNFANKLIDFCMVNNVVFDFNTSPIQFKEGSLADKEEEYDLKVQKEPGIVQDMNGTLLLKLSADTINPILSNVTGDCKKKLLRYVDVNFDRVANNLGFLFFF